MTAVDCKVEVVPDYREIRRQALHILCVEDKWCKAPVRAKRESQARVAVSKSRDNLKRDRKEDASERQMKRRGEKKAGEGWRE